MEYRVIEIDNRVSDRARRLEIARFDSAYRAADYVSESWYRGDSRADRLYVIDTEDTILLTPYDLIATRPYVR